MAIRRVFETPALLYIYLFRNILSPATLVLSRYPGVLVPGPLFNCMWHNPRQMAQSLFWALHMNGIIQHVAFGVGLLSLSSMFSRCIHVVACVSTSFLFNGWMRFHSMNSPHFVYRFKGIWVVSTWLLQITLLWSSDTSVCLNPWFPFLRVYGEEWDCGTPRWPCSAFGGTGKLFSMLHSHQHFLFSIF